MSEVTAMNRKIKFALAASCALMNTLSALADTLPPLNQIVVNRDNQRLQAELQKGGLSRETLGMALVAAAGVNNIAAVKQLLAAGAPIEFTILARTPLIVAVVEQHEEVVQLLLENGANPNVSAGFDWKPLHFAITQNYASTSIIALLLEHGAYVNSRTSLAVTPLHRAAGFCKLEVVNFLLQEGADKTLQDKYGLTAEKRAQKSGCEDVAQLVH
jgi:uncharacterized protein